MVKPCLFVARRDAADVEPLGPEAPDEVGVGLAAVEEDADGDSGAAAFGEGLDEPFGGEVEHGDVDGAGGGTDLGADGGFQGAALPGGSEVGDDGIVLRREQKRKAGEEGQEP
jgi:hypothetical protein